MYHAAANDIAILQEHAYYETGLEKHSSMKHYQWVSGIIGFIIALWLVKVIVNARASRKKSISLPVSQETV